MNEEVKKVFPYAGHLFSTRILSFGACPNKYINVLGDYVEKEVYYFS